MAVSLCLILLGKLTAQSLNPHIDRDQLHVSGPKIHFLVDEVLARLHDGATVKFEFQLSVLPDRGGKVLARADEMFAVSYDLWEEKFAVRKLGSPAKSVSHLSASDAEAWCFDNTTLPVSVLGNQSFWIRVDYRAVDAGASNGQSDNSGFTLSGLIDIFSRRTRGEQLHGSEEIGPVSLEKLRRK